MEIKLFFWGIVIISFLALTLFQGISLFKTRKRICMADATIVEIIMPANEAMKIYNSKWARVSYQIEDRIVTSENRIQVPMSSDIGDIVKIKYDKGNPRILFSQTKRKLLFAFSGLVLSLVLFLISL